MTGTTTLTTEKKIELGCIAPRNIISSEGRIVGQITGGWIDIVSWKVTELVIEVNKDIVDELNVKKPALRSAKVAIPVQYVKNVGDVVQLDVDVSSLSKSIVEEK